jgi:hypothetical protein
MNAWEFSTLPFPRRLYGVVLKLKEEFKHFSFYVYSQYGGEVLLVRKSQNNRNIWKEAISALRPLP